MRFPSSIRTRRSFHPGVFPLVFPTLALVAALTLGQPAPAAEPPAYGPPIALEQAKAVIAAAQAEAKKQKWAVAVAVVDSGGHLVAFEKMDNTQLGSIEVAQEKAKCSALFRRSTKVFDDGLAAGGAGARVLKVPGVIPVEGGFPILIDGKLVGAVGVSGVKPNEDGQVAQAAVDSLKAK